MLKCIVLITQLQNVSLLQDKKACIHDDINKLQHVVKLSDFLMLPFLGHTVAT